MASDRCDDRVDREANLEDGLGTIFEWGGARYAVVSLEVPEASRVGASVGTPGTSKLTSAEMEVARLVADGRSNREIALERGTSTRTIANQVASILKKLKLRSRVGLAECFVRAARRTL